MYKRVFLIVLDSFGIGEMLDAAAFGDVGSNTLAAIVKSEKYNTPVLSKMGLFNIDGVNCKRKETQPIASFARLKEMSEGKDTTIGHWEIAGVESEKPLPTFPNGFPNSIINELSSITKRKIICNKPYSGTQVLYDFGEEHVKTGALIVYTSADSVLQIAAHEDIVPVEKLYEYCDAARNIMCGEHGVGRIIARPFIGEDKNSFKRTANRHDISLPPPKKTMLDYLTENGKAVIGVGKIYDIFAGKGISEKIKTSGNENGMDVTLELAKRDFNGLAFINLVDFDMLYGHRNDVHGYALAATRFDEKLKELLPLLNDNDLLLITADHGCDPSTPSTDHSREYVPLLIYSNTIKAGVNLGTINSFATIAATICDALSVTTVLPRKSILGNVLRGE